MSTHLSTALKLRVGDLVEVKAPREILATLDERGTYQALPFMPEMLAYCGKRFSVYKRAEKVCDTIDKTGIRRMKEAVLLTEIRCDGQAHGGCDARCMLIWKEAWLKRVGSSSGHEPVLMSVGSAPNTTAAEDTLRNLVCTNARQPASADGAVRYVCQSTELKKATLPLKVWDLRQYWRDARGGNVGWRQAVEGLLIMLFNWVQSLRGGAGYPVCEQGRLKTTPKGNLDLKSGELVKVKSKDDILQTLDVGNRNRGLFYDVEMLKHCGRNYRVKGRVHRLVNEKTGELVNLSNDCIILEDVMCQGECHQFCSRSEYIYWREVWLARSGS
jgi:hypothetical protein